MRRGKSAGFTLVEVLLSLLIFTIGAVSLLSMQLTSLDANQRSRELQEATQLCQDKVEQLKLVPLPLPAPPAGGETLDARGCLVTGDPRAECATLLPGQRYTRTWLVDPTTAGRFEVDTSWTGSDAQTHKVAVDDVR